MEKVFCRGLYNYDADKVSLETGIEFNDQSLTKQSFAEECDINTIVKRFGLTGELPQNVTMPQYADFEHVVDFHSALNAVNKANESFMQMPAEIRARFHNNPAEFVDFCFDDANIDEAVKLGLVPRKAETPIEKPPAEAAGTVSP